jgi:2-amino-4-hydroxy-6-hydroxymethyldihydropteridine diphosphokinase
MAISLIGIGANLGDRANTLRRAVQMLGQHADTRAFVVSGWHENRAIGGPSGQQPFLNGAMRLETALAPEALARLLGEIEQTLGRQRGQRWEARPLDLDLLLYDELSLSTPELTIPHPRMAFRRFVLEPANEVAADMVHPRIGWSVSQLLEHLTAARSYVAITGLPATGKTLLARRLAAHFGGRLIADPCVAASKTPKNPAFVAPMPGDLPSRTVQREIEFLGNRTAAIDRVRWAAGDELLVSDFWLGQSLAYAALELTDKQFLKVDACYQQCRQVALPPKILVVLSGDGRNINRADTLLPEQERLAATLAEQADRPGIGPTMFLDPNEPELVWAELTAAIEAMR